MARRADPTTGRAPARRGAAPGPQRGFVLTLELLLLITILVLGSLVGLVAVRDALFKRYVGKQSQQAILVDAAGRVLGEAVDFDEHDAPRLFYIDRSLAPARRVLIGIRDDRFSSREPLYYAGGSCSGPPCIKATSDERADSTGIDGVSGSGAVSYLNALQGPPNYAVGRGADGLPGALYRESGDICPVAVEEIGSRWVSQKVVRGEPCEAVDLAGTATEPAYSQCLISSLEPCACPVGYEDQGDLLAGYLPAIRGLLDTTLASVNIILLPTGQQLEPVAVGTLCCPEATSLRTEALAEAVVYTAVNRALATLDLTGLEAIRQALENLLAPLAGEVVCTGVIELRATAAVPAPGDPSRNALEVFTGPFRVNLPPAAQDSDWRSTPPRGEGTSTP